MPRNKSITDEALLASCRATFLAAGVSVSTVLLAKQAGVSQGVLFQRFGTKDELFFAALRLPAPEFAVTIKKAFGASPVEGLVEFGLAISRYLNAQMPVILVVLSHPAYRQSRPDSSELLRDAQSIGRHLGEYLGARFDVDDVDATAELFVASLLTNAFHGALGVGGDRDERAWLLRLITALGLA